MSRRHLTAVLAVLAIVALAVPATAAGKGRTTTYEVTITNTTEGQWLTPPAVATHRSGFQLFDTGSPATVAVQKIAENGDLSGALGAFAASGDVRESLVAFPDPAAPGPVAPGESVTFEITGDVGSRISFASMLICTNDGFTGAEGIRLPRGKRTEVHELNAYDAGTEVNTEAWGDLVPPCASLTGFGDQGGTGMSNPALAENGIVVMHPGITGSADLVPSVHGWHGTVATISITRKG